MNNFGLTDTVLENIITVFRGYGNIENIILYGSRAKGDYRNGSDIDITVKGHNIRTSTLFRIEEELDDLMLAYKIDVSIYENIDNIDLIKHINRVGIELSNLFPPN